MLLRWACPGAEVPLEEGEVSVKQAYACTYARTHTHKYVDVNSEPFIMSGFFVVGRGRGEGGFYQRGVEEEVGFGRGREVHRSQSWEDRLALWSVTAPSYDQYFSIYNAADSVVRELGSRSEGCRVDSENRQVVLSRCVLLVVHPTHSVTLFFRGERRFEKPPRREGGRGGFEDGGTGRKDYNRADSDNWRTLREEQEDEEGAEPGGSWRLAVARRDGKHTHTHTNES